MRTAVPLVKRMYLDKTGLEMYLGTIEARIMRSVWEGNTTITRIHRDIYHTYGELAKSSISTTVTRLVNKRYLIKLPISDSLHREHTYLPCTNTEEELTEMLTQIVVNALYLNYPDELDLAIALTQAGAQTNVQQVS